ncbi:hypothetical protein [uncultured Ferrimonas sp.]|uniref:hypothetical protein n=1 Tax=uncultured Ferrimonas sp. TaxID=432640 RepID=UPI002621E0A2|nr:hypothetical protein [uncultured Ferrimonas sp.]
MAQCYRANWLCVSLVLIGLFSVSTAMAAARTARNGQHQADMVRVCGKLAEVSRFEQGLYLSLNEREPNLPLTLIVWNDDVTDVMARDGAVYQSMGKRICARGIVKTQQDYRQRRGKHASIQSGSHHSR